MTPYETYPVEDDRALRVCFALIRFIWGCMEIGSLVAFFGVLLLVFA